MEVENEGGGGDGGGRRKGRTKFIQQIQAGNLFPHFT